MLSYFYRKVLGGLDTSGAHLTSQDIARFWLDGKTSLARHQNVKGNDLANAPNGMFCIMLDDIKYYTLLMDSTEKWNITKLGYHLYSNHFPGGMCKSVTDWKRNEHEADPFRVYAKPCSEKRYYLCESKKPSQ